jgi:hemimethylated DNA binding protein
MIGESFPNPMWVSIALQLTSRFFICSLIRIRSSWIARHFDRFDSLRRCFVPNEGRAFQYPLDNPHYSDVEESTETQSRNEIGKQIVSGVQEFASRLERLIPDVTSSAESRELGLLALFQDRLSSLANGDIVPDSAFLSAKDLSHGDLASYQLRHLLNLTMELADLLRIRRISKEEKQRIRFSLGEVVQHKKYGFRGVIVAWDPKPAVDVSRWDGLGDIENAADLPFYHVVPDQGDCIEAFGGERPFRYVCEANLEPCPRERSFIDVDLEPGWERISTNPEYSPPVDIKFKYAEYLDDKEVTASCLTAIMVR